MATDTKQTYVWSRFQKAAFFDIAKGTGNTIIIARAGSAKTSTIVEGSKYIPRGKSALFCAFNKHIQEELKSKLGSYVECKTMHSLGFAAIKQRFGNIELDNRKCWQIVEQQIDNPKDNYDLIENICKTVDLCKATLTDIPSKIDELIADNGIDICEVEPKAFIQYVCQTLRKCKEMTNKIDFNDMVWFPFVFKLNVGKYSYVFLDEFQDLSKSMIELALSAVKPDGRVIAVGDDRQAIYSWRTGNTNVLEDFRKRLSPKELPLPICYRCPQKVVELAQKYVPDIQVYDQAIVGEIIDINTNDLAKYAKAGSYILSRVNAPLIKICLSFLKNNIPANILGRDIGDGLLYLVKKSKKKKVDAFLKWVDDWAKKEKQRILDKYPNANTETIDDKVECLYNLCEGAKDTDEIKTNIELLFKDNDEKKIILLSSIHRIKGKESDTVFVLTDTLRYSSEEEINIVYVSFTRARKTLYRVSKNNS